MRLQPRALVEGAALAPCARARFLGAAAMGKQCPVRSSLRVGVAGGALRGPRLLRQQAPPLPPPSPPCPPTRPIRSPRPGRAGSLVWPAEAERDLNEPRRPPTRDKRDSREPALPGAAASSLLSRGRSGGRDSPPLPSEVEGAEKAERRLRESARRPLPPRLGAGGGGGGGKCASFPGGESFTSRLGLQLAVA